LEYYIIKEGLMWNSILDILVEKVKQGVEVRVIYDDMGCVLTLPYGYDKKLEKMGIKVLCFQYADSCTVCQNKQQRSQENCSN